MLPWWLACLSLPLVAAAPPTAPNRCPLALHLQAPWAGAAPEPVDWDALLGEVLEKGKAVPEVGWCAPGEDAALEVSEGLTESLFGWGCQQSVGDSRLERAALPATSVCPALAHQPTNQPPYQLTQSNLPGRSWAAAAS